MGASYTFARDSGCRLKIGCFFGWGGGGVGGEIITFVFNATSFCSSRASHSLSSKPNQAPS